MSLKNHDKESYRQPSIPKRKFSKEEDILLKSLVEEYGTNEWEKISKNIPGRNIRQCRERWMNYVNPNIVSSPWTTSEDEELENLISRFGSQWKIISHYFPNRAINNIKNRWILLKRKQQQQQHQQHQQTHKDQKDQQETRKQISPCGSYPEINFEQQISPMKETKSELTDREESISREATFNMFEYLDSVFNESDFFGFVF